MQYYFSYLLLLFYHSSTNAIETFKTTELGRREYAGNRHRCIVSLFMKIPRLSHSWNWIYSKSSLCQSYLPSQQIPPLRHGFFPHQPHRRHFHTIRKLKTPLWTVLVSPRRKSVCKCLYLSSYFILNETECQQSVERKSIATFWLALKISHFASCIHALVIHKITLSYKVKFQEHFIL